MDRENICKNTVSDVEAIGEIVDIFKRGNFTPERAVGVLDKVKLMFKFAKQLCSQQETP